MGEGVYRPHRLSCARKALENSDLGALLVFDTTSIYLTSTKIGEWGRDKNCRWAQLTRGRPDPILWDFGLATVHHRLYAPWLQAENCKACWACATPCRRRSV